FWLDRGGDAPTSKALWIPTLWIMINFSRPLSVWLGMAPAKVDPSIYLEGSPVDRAGYLILLIAGLIVLFIRSGQAGAKLRRNGAVLAYFSYAALSALWSDYPFVTFKHWTKGIGDVAMVLIVVTELHPEAAIKWLLSRSGFIFMPLSLLYSKYYPDLGRFLSPGWVSEYAGVTQNKNELGQICLIFGLGALWCFLSIWEHRERPDRRRRLTAYGGYLTVIIWLFVMANSMTSLCCVVLAAVVMIWASRRSVWTSGSIHVAAGAAIGVAALALFGDPQMVTMVGRNATLTGRTDIWHWVLTLVRNPLLGTGYESFFMGPRLKAFWHLDNDAFASLQEAHNGYLEVYLNLGWVGVAIFASLIVTGYRRVIAAFRANPRFGRLTLAWFIAAIIYGFTEAGYRMQTPIWIIFLLAIMAAPETEELPPNEPADEDLAWTDATQPAANLAWSGR
ncbi:MAG: O-antigen ligase family protein, partial [Terriglobia bacterium]